MKPIRRPAGDGERMRLRKNRRQINRWKQLERVLLALSGALLVAAAVLAGWYLIKTQQTIHQQESLRAVYAGRPSDQSTAPVLSSGGDLEQPPDVAEAPEAAEPTEIAPLAEPGPQAQASGMNAAFVPLYARNNDLVGWLKAEGIREMDFPVLQRDNVYYMNHDFTGRQNPAGSAFLDEANAIRPLDNNLIIHAHNMKNGTMFGKLFHYQQLNFIVEHPVIQFDTLYQLGAYVPYAVAVISTDPSKPHYFSACVPRFANVDALYAYVNRLRELSSLALPVDLMPDDRLLTLITCHGREGHERLIVALRALRDNETPDSISDAFRRLASKT